MKGKTKGGMNGLVVGGCCVRIGGGSGLGKGVGTGLGDSVGAWGPLGGSNGCTGGGMGNGSGFGPMTGGGVGVSFVLMPPAIPGGGVIEIADGGDVGRGVVDGGCCALGGFVWEPEGRTFVPGMGISGSPSSRSTVHDWEGDILPR